MARYIDNWQHLTVGERALLWADRRYNLNSRAYAVQYVEMLRENNWDVESTSTPDNSEFDISNTAAHNIHVAVSRILKGLEP